MEDYTILSDNRINDWLQALLQGWGLNEYLIMATKILILAIGLLVLSYVVNLITKKIIIKFLEKLIIRSKSIYDDYFIKHKVLERLSYLAPALVIYLLSDIVFEVFPKLDAIVKHTVFVIIVVTLVRSMNAFLDALEDIYNHFPNADERPVKGYVQIAKLIAYSVAALMIVSIVFGIQLTSIFAGMGAMAAVLMLIFKDTILGFVAGIQLSANRMVRVGDWISMPSHKADGTVLEVTLNTVKVQNWDKTISTIPTYAMVSDSFMNWRGMEDSGGRRIKRSINIDMKSIKFCTPEMIKHFQKIHYLKDYVIQREQEITEHNQKNKIDDTIVVNGRRMTNVGMFRNYLERYLRNHPKIHQEMTLLVRHLQPSEKGLPIEIYAFSNDQAWANYETIQADIFDHILAVLPEFDLCVFQYPTEQGGVFN